MREEPRLRVAAFRPDDERLAAAVELLESLGADPVADPMLAVEPTDRVPRGDADYVVLTSKTGVELAAGGDWDPGTATVCAIGEATAAALREAGYTVAVVPEEYSSTGLVEALEAEVAGSRVEVARSDHGSPVLTDGLEAAGAYVHETVLYRLVRPPESGESAELAADGELDAALFTSSLTVRHFLAAAADRGVRDEAIEGLREATVGAIGNPTKETAENAGISVDVVPERADFETLACDVVETAAPTYHD
ncbi:MULTISPECIES: uroporphyrinogen-III synthase [Haloarcula]|uniref:Uroporphyrinogen-III synthase n=1 Tax=Haloarcula pellucida TaxID=1427151 RepID=A0A830GIF9_9EURY|nr:MULTISPECIES: uroporphyrinogen-III synthase [Halomicroarcula]MBX0348893.1 uroporphyrinogen-III synthase [Halomicroarcula pellucida]MDS0278657.1 uroporphyrinogen-III synthase [Halomicroarcula sp. S1AR25-4]GGN91348.1 uroporphyrinogen-III synthase [Halomicroarcula pellucida]